VIETPRRCNALWLIFPVVALALLPRTAGAEPTPQRTPEPLYGAYLAGIHAQTIRDYKAADAWLTKAWRADPDATELIARTFIAALADGRFAEARALASREVKGAPGNALAGLVLLVEELKAGDAPAALASARGLPQTGIHRFVRPLALAWAHAAAKDFDGAEAALNGLDRFEDLAPLKHYQAGLIDDFAGHTEKADANFKGALKASGKLNWRLTYVIGNFYARHGRNKEAEALYRRFFKENAQSDLARSLLAHPPAAQPRPVVASPADGLAEALFDLASVLDAPETRDLALIYTRLALALAPDNGGAELLLGDILSAEGHPRQSLAVLAKIPFTSRYSWSARLRVAANLDASGERDKAIALLNGMAQAEPTWSGALIELGDLLRAAKRYPEAVKAYEEAIRRLEAGGIPVAWALDYSLGIALDRSSHWQEAEKALLKALKLKPDEPFVLNYLGYSWVNRGRHLHHGLRLLEKAVALRPNDGFIIDSLGWAHYRLGDYAAAVTYLEKATELVPDDPTINDHLGDAYWRAGRPREARFEWSQALQFGPKKNKIKPIEAKLERGLGPAGGG
jgi:tetratricopeptide (TPR) repeat protein